MRREVRAGRREEANKDKVWKPERVAVGKKSQPPSRARALEGARGDRGGYLDIVDLDLLGGGAALLVRVAVLVELEAAVAILVGAEGVGLVDLGGVGELAVRLAVRGD